MCSVRDALKTLVPDSLRSGPLEELLRRDTVAYIWLRELLGRVPPATGGPVGGVGVGAGSLPTTPAAMIGGRVGGPSAPPT